MFEGRMLYLDVFISKLDFEMKADEAKCAAQERKWCTHTDAKQFPDFFQNSKPHSNTCAVWASGSIQWTFNGD